MRIKIIIAVVALALIAGFLFLGREADHRPPPAEVVTPSPTGSAPAPAVSPIPSESEEGVTTLPAHGTLELDRASLLGPEPLVLHLEFGPDAPDAEPLSGRLLVEGVEPVDLSEVIRSARPGVARVEIDPDLLYLGRNIIEIKTNERSHIPLRRYVVEIR